MDDVVLVSFWAAFIIDLFIAVYAFRLARRVGGRGILSLTVTLTAGAAVIFGMHHLLEVFLEAVPNGLEIAEGVEGVAAITLAFAVFQFYRLVRGD